ncbi:initiator Replication family protein [Clostridioides difficile CD160]|nr:initiator Replication family protein [Clostridioides difficile CD160]
MNELLNKKAPKVLMKNNVLIHAKYSMTLNENRLFLLILYNLQKSCDDGSMKCQFKCEDLKGIIKKTNDRTKKNIEELLNSLSNKKIDFVELLEDNTQNKGKYNIVTGYLFIEKTQSFEVECSQTIHTLLTKYLETGYTPLNLAVLFSLRNYYAQRLYDLIRIWSGTKQVINYKVQAIKEYLMIEESYKEYGNFKRRVLIPAIDALNETEYFNISYEELKIGRKVDSINFIVEDLDKRKYFDKNIIEDISFREVDEEESKDKKQISNDNCSGPKIENNNDLETSVQQDRADLNEDNNNKESFNLEKTNEDVESKIKSSKASDEKVSNKGKSPKGEFFVPDEEVFTRGTLRLFKKDFKNYNFHENENLKAFDRAVAITLEKDDIDVIKTASYDYFKSTCFNIIADYAIEKELEKKHEEEMNEYWHNKKNYMSVDEEKGPVDENIRKKLFDAGLVNEDGYYYK